MHRHIAPSFHACQFMPWDACIDNTTAEMHRLHICTQMLRHQPHPKRAARLWTHESCDMILPVLWRAGGWASHLLWLVPSFALGSELFEVMHKTVTGHDLESLAGLEPPASAVTALVCNW